MADKKPKIMLWDLENTPSLGYVWGKYDQNVNEFAEDWYILSISWKYLGEKQVHVLGLNDFPNYKRNKKDDKQLCLKIRDLLDDADVIIAHNGDRFDMRKAKARLLVHGLDPPSPSKQVDTLKIARKVAMFTSNKLGDLGETLGIGGKEETGGFKTWLGCMEGDEKSWRIMKRYNKADVVLLEQVYLKLLPWIDNGPNMAVLQANPEACPKCGSSEGMIKRGRQANRTMVYQTYQCSACKGYSSARLSESVERPNYK